MLNRPDLLADLRPASVPVDAWEGRGKGALSEAGRLQAMKAAATPDRDVGPVPVAPAAGAFRVTTPWTVTPGGVRQRDGFAGRDRVERVSALELIAAKGRLTPGQVAIGHRYAALVERHDAGGLRCASLEAGRGRSGDGGGATDARLAEAREIAALRRRIGDGLAMPVRRVRPSDRGPGARQITDRELVDAVCLGGLDLTGVLRVHGWSEDGKNRLALRRALCDALDRMSGYRGIC